MSDGRLIPWARPSFPGNERRYLVEALESTWISGGAFIERFEREFAALHGVRHAVATSNGTTALHLAYLVAGVAAGHEVIVPGFGFAAPANLALHLGAKPVFADVDPDTWLLDPGAVEALVTPRTRALVPIHSYGNVCDMDPLREIAARHRLALIEDAAESAFSAYRGRRAGTLGDLGCFSFQATKTITMGEGGAVLTERDDLADRMVLIRSHGMRRKRHYWHEAVGHNFRLTNLQAALGCAQLEGLDRLLGERAALYGRYRERLGGAPGLRLQVFPGEVKPVVWALGARLDPARFGERDGVMERMKEAGIETRPGFHPYWAMGLYEGAPKLPVADQLSAEVILLPFHPGLAGEQVDRIAGTLLALGR